MDYRDLYADDERTAVRSYTKGELAMMYSPRAKYESAIRMLNRYLHRCRGLLDELMAMGGYYTTLVTTE